jgi:AAA+ superfamily predicted ATPase
MFSSGSWLDEFLLKRRANVTNVFIFETSDLKRVQQFIQFILACPDFTTHKKYIFDLQLQDIRDVETGSPVLEEQSFLGPMVPTASVNLRKLLTNLRVSPIILIITYAYDAKHSQLLQEFLVSASHDDQVYGQKSTVAVFTSDASLFNPVVRRLAYTITIPPSLADERREVLNRIRAELQERFGKQLDLNISPDVVNASSGLNLYDVETAAIESFSRYGDFRIEVFTEYKVKLLREVGLEYIQPVRGFESVGGYDYLKRYIINRVIKVLRNPEIAQKYGLSVPKGILLYGPPGTGKTWFAKALAKEVGLPMVIVDPSTFLRGIVGETEMRIKHITYLIEGLSPIIVFIDEFDQLALSRKSVLSTDSGVSRRMANMLLSWLGDENRRSFIVGATNFASDIDPAFLRPGRLDEIIPVLYPDFDARLEILRVHTSIIRRVPLGGDVDLAEIARLTHMWSGAELEKLILEASGLAMESDSQHVSQEHFYQALKTIQVNVSEREERLKKMLQELKAHENVNHGLLNSALQSWNRDRIEGERIRVRGVVT